MKHVLYSLFQDAGEADAAIADIKSAGLKEDVYNVIVHRGKVEESDLSHSETDSWQGLVIGLVLGVTLGAAFGWILAGPAHLLAIGKLESAVFGAILGAIIGVISGGINGAGATDRKLKKLIQIMRDGQVLVTAEVEGWTAEDTIGQIFRKHGGISSPKKVM